LIHNHTADPVAYLWVDRQENKRQTTDIHKLMAILRTPTGGRRNKRTYMACAKCCVSYTSSNSSLLTSSTDSHLAHWARWRAELDHSSRMKTDGYCSVLGGKRTELFYAQLAVSDFSPDVFSRRHSRASATFLVPQ